jgi:hypothetical protein
LPGRFAIGSQPRHQPDAGHHHSRIVPCHGMYSAVGRLANVSGTKGIIVVAMPRSKSGGSLDRGWPAV